MKKNLHITRIALVLALAVSSFGLSFAGPKKKASAMENTCQLQSEIRQIVDSPANGYRNDIEGEAEIFFSLDDNDRVQIKGVFSTSDDLAAYIEQKLDGAAIKKAEVVPGTTYRMKLRMVDLR